MNKNSKCKKPYGIPYLGENNIEKWHDIIISAQDIHNIKTIETSMIELISEIDEKDNLVIMDGKYLTWLEDIKFNYVKHTCKLPYIKFSLFSTSKERDARRNKAHNHIEYVEKAHSYTVNKNRESINIQNSKQFMLIRYDFEYLMKEINLGDDLIIFNLKNDKITRYIIKSWVNHQSKNQICVFSIERLYNLYKEYSFYDIKTEFSGHESGYTYINIESNRLKNPERTIRKSFGLPEWKSEPIEVDYRDVRVYKYFDYISRISKSIGVDSTDISLQAKLFKYRRLAFESYLYCHIIGNSLPQDIDKYPEWEKLGKTLDYIKISDGNLPFFIKAEWKPDNKLNIKKTWRRA